MSSGEMDDGAAGEGDDLTGGGEAAAGDAPEDAAGLADTADDDPIAALAKAAVRCAWASATGSPRLDRAAPRPHAVAANTAASTQPA
jgi:hypothetical protein